MSKGFQLIDETMHDYMLSVSSRESAIQHELREITDAQVDMSVMLSTPNQMQSVALLLKLINAKSVIEVGVYTGYGSLVMADALPEDGQLIACDVSEEWANVGKPYWQKAGVDKKIDLRIGDAADTLEQLLSSHGSDSFDAIFIDADKANYDSYYELALKLVRKRGLIIVDNTLACGKDLTHELDCEEAISINALNKKIQSDSRVDCAMLPVSQGMYLVAKR